MEFCKKKMNGTSTRCKNITLNDNGILLDKDKEKAELFAHSFSNKYLVIITIVLASKLTRSI